MPMLAYTHYAERSAFVVDSVEYINHAPTLA
jgi:hypothetical protein